MVDYVNLIHDALNVAEESGLVPAITEAGPLLTSRLFNMETSMELLQRGLDLLIEAIAEHYASATDLLVTLRQIHSNDESIGTSGAANESSLATALSENVSLATSAQHVRSSIEALRARLVTLTSGTQANVSMLSNREPMTTAELYANLDAPDNKIAVSNARVQSSFCSMTASLATSKAGLDATHDRLNTFLASVNLSPAATTKAEDHNSTGVLSNLTTSSGRVQSSTNEIPTDRSVPANIVGNIQARVEQLPDNTTHLYQRRLEVLEQSVELMRADIGEILGLMRNMARSGVPPPYGD